MTETEKKAIYDKRYVHWLKFYKNEFKNYCNESKIPVEAKLKVIEHIKAIFDVMKKCGVCMYPEKVKEPMDDVASIMLKFGVEGDPESVDDFMICTRTSCWRTVMFEKTPEEIESAARKNAQHDVEFAEWKEKQKIEETEKKCKEEVQRGRKVESSNQKTIEHDLEAKRAEEEEARAKLELKRKTMKAWHSATETLLDDIRCGLKHWYAEEHLTEAELKAVKKYAATLLAFTEAQNKGLTGIGLYHQNEMRATAHEELLEVFGLTGNEYAEDITKSYDFSDDYDYKTQTYKHLPEDTVVNLLAFALINARKIEQNIDGAAAAIAKVKKL
jgi:hypothetical protein